VVVVVVLVGRTLGNRLGVVVVQIDPVLHILGTLGWIVVVGSFGEECTSRVERSEYGQWKWFGWT